MDSIKKNDHFYLIDGSGYIFRAYYALPPLSRKSDGLPTGAVSGFCSMLFKLLEDSRSDDSIYKPTHFGRDANLQTSCDLVVAVTLFSWVVFFLIILDSSLYNIY